MMIPVAMVVPERERPGSLDGIPEAESDNGYRNAGYKDFPHIERILIAFECEKRLAEGQKLFPQNHQSRQYGSYVECYVELQAVGSRKIQSENLAAYLEMTGGTDGKIFGKPLYYAQNEGVESIHRLLFLESEMFRIDDYGSRHTHETKKCHARTDDNAACAEDIGIECLLRGAPAKHQYESCYYDGSCNGHCNEIGLLQGHPA